MTTVLLLSSEALFVVSRPHGELKRSPRSSSRGRGTKEGTGKREEKIWIGADEGNGETPTEVFQIRHLWLVRAGLTIRGPHTNIRRGPFLIREATIFSGRALFFPEKVVVFTSRPTPNVCSAFRRQNSMVKNWPLVGGPWRREGPSHGTTGTMVNPAALGIVVVVVLVVGLINS